MVAFIVDWATQKFMWNMKKANIGFIARLTEVQALVKWMVCLDSPFLREIWGFQINKNTFHFMDITSIIGRSKAKEEGTKGQRDKGG